MGKVYIKVNFEACTDNETYKQQKIKNIKFILRLGE